MSTVLYYLAGCAYLFIEIGGWVKEGGEMEDDVQSGDFISYGVQYYRAQVPVG